MTNVIPKNMEEFISQGWDKKIKYRLSKLTLPPQTNIEQLVQEILVALIETDYIIRYNEAARSFEVYIYIFVENFIKKLALRQGLNSKGYGIVDRKNFEGLMKDEDNFEGVIYLAALGMADLYATEKEAYNELIEEIKKELESLKGTSKETPKDPLVALQLLQEDKLVTMLADIVFKIKEKFKR